MLHAIHKHWRPGWDEIMLYPRLIPEPLDYPYNEDEGLRGPITFEWQKYYFHTAYVVEGCRTADPGFISMPSEGKEGGSDHRNGSRAVTDTRFASQFSFESAIDFSNKIPFSMVGIGGLEYWVAGVREGTVDLGEGRTAIRFHKFAVGRMPYVIDRGKIREQHLGLKKLVAYLEPEF